jgi:dienelactone hydrolase
MRQLIASVVDSGRAFVWPIYNNTYERRRGLNAIELRLTRPNDYRDYVFQLSYDLGRSIDYLETRDDIESGSLGYLGFSWGANVGFILVAMENRLKAAVFASGGLYTEPALPQADQFNYVSRIRIPALMLNGRYDLGNPVKTETEFVYQQLGSSDKDLKLFDTGHAVPRAAICEHAIEWFDSHLGR